MDLMRAYTVFVRYNVLMIHEVGVDVSVVVLFDVLTAKVTPWRFKWNNREYTIRQITLQYPVRNGRVLHHMFEVYDGKQHFQLDFNTETLKWRINKTDDGFPS